MKEKERNTKDYNLMSRADTKKKLMRQSLSQLTSEQSEQALKPEPRLLLSSTSVLEEASQSRLEPDSPTLQNPSNLAAGDLSDGAKESMLTGAADARQQTKMATIEIQSDPFGP